MTTAGERLHAALGHREANRVPLDLGSTQGTSMHPDSLYRLRQALQLDPPGTPVKVIEPFLATGRHRARPDGRSWRGRRPASNVNDPVGLPE